MQRTLPGIIGMLLVLVACAAPGGASPIPSPTGGGGGPGGDGEIEHPTGADEPILIVDVVGGFVPVQFVATRAPAFVLLGDGRVLLQGMQTLEFPGPALPPLIERRLTAEGIQMVLAGIEETNLFTSDLDLRGAMSIVADAPDTVFILDAGGRRVTVSVYALGLLVPGMEPPQGMGSGEVQAHEVLSLLNDRLMTLESWLPADAWEADGWRPYEAEAFRLYVRDVTGQPVEPGDLPEHVRAWPTDDDPAAFGEEQVTFGDGTRCGVVEGDAGAIWLDELTAATQMTLWTDDGERRFSVIARPLLPHEDAACPDLVGA
jgi:hypothetical protein